MIVTTKNSIYSVVGKGNKIHITKVAALDTSKPTAFAIGRTVISDYISIVVGGPMLFQEGTTIIATSTVCYIEG